jgi:multidrug efflux pump subunit AcrA (membrane-fusion protein)
MKKYVFLYTFTAIAAAAILAVGQMIRSTFIHVSTVKASTSTVENTVICTGKVEANPGSNIYAVSPGIIKQLFVKTGSKVTAGQAMMEVLPLSPSQSSSSSTTDEDAKMDSSLSAANAYGIYSAYLNRMKGGSSNSSVSGNPQGTEEGKNTSYIIRATATGTVGSLTASEAGAYIDSSKPAAVIQNGNDLQIRLNVDESQASDIKVGQSVQISGVGFRNSIYSGKVTCISGEAKQLVSTTGQETVIDVLASVNHPGADLKAGFTVKAKITTASCSHILVLPYEAVRENANGGEFVYCIVKSHAKKTPVITGREFDNGIEIKSGVHENNSVITNPDEISDGAKVIPDSVTPATGENHD